MSTVLPGELVPAEHVNLKLGPGLLQLSTAQGPSRVISTRAGTLNHSANNRDWWVECNARRVSSYSYISSGECH
jgi:exosome complex component RRP40